MNNTEIIDYARNTPAQISIFIVIVYRHLFSPLKNFIFGPQIGCRFHPTCSAYAIECLRNHGFIFGGYYTLRRILRCHPFHRGGYDPAPKKTEVMQDHSSQ